MRPVRVKLASYLAATSLAAFTLAVYLLATKYTWCVPFGFHLFKAVAPLLACMVLVYFVNERFLSQVVLGLVLTLGIVGNMALWYVFVLDARSQALATLVMNMVPLWQWVVLVASLLPIYMLKKQRAVTAIRWLKPRQPISPYANRK